MCSIFIDVTGLRTFVVRKQNKIIGGKKNKAHKMTSRAKTMSRLLEKFK